MTTLYGREIIESIIAVSQSSILHVILIETV